MKKLLTALMLLCGAIMATPVVAPPKTVVAKKIKVVTTLSVNSALVKEIGGDLVETASLSQAKEDPHFVKAKPTFKRLVSDADLFMQIGRSLELWVPLVVDSSQNTKLISGKGLITLSTGVQAIEVPSQLTRNSGDIHPQGNPHIWLSPVAVKQMAINIKDALISVDAAHKESYEKNYQKFNKDLATHLFGDELVKASGSSFDFLYNQLNSGLLSKYLAGKGKQAGGWVKKMSQVDYPFFTYHTVFSYLAKDFSIKIAGQIEEKAGVAPTKKYENQLIKQGKEQGIKHIVVASYYQGTADAVVKSLANGIGGKSLFVDVDCLDGESYFTFMDRLVDALLKFKGTPTPATEKIKTNAQPHK